MRAKTNQTRGAAGQQYAIVVGLVAVIAIASVASLGNGVGNLLRRTGNTLVLASNGLTSEAVSTPAPPPVATLVPGNTTLVVTRNGFSVRCTAWSGRLCTAPEMQPNPSLFADCTGTFSLSTWYFVYNQDQAQNKFCYIATESSAVALTSARSQTNVQNNYFHGSTLGTYNGSGGYQCGRNAGIAAGTGASGWLFSYYQPFTGNYTGSDGLNIDCSGW